MTTHIPADPPATSVNPDTATVRPVTLTNRDADRDADRIAAAISAARTESTRRVYAYTWGQWARWCAARKLSPLPGDPAALCAYLTERAAEGIAVSSLDGACTAVRHVHRTHGAADPVASETVRQVRLGLRRTYGTAPRRLAGPLSTADIRQILTGIDLTDPVGIRDAALILLGYASAMRRSELVARTLLDVEEKPNGLLITLRRSKTDQEGHGETVAVARGCHRQTDPVAALTAWRMLCGHAPGPLFTRFFRSQISLRPLSGDAVARMLRAGLDAERITAHSLRAGHVTTRRWAGSPLPASPHRRDTRPVGAGEPLHPPRRGARHHVQPRPRAKNGHRSQHPGGRPSARQPPRPRSRNQVVTADGCLACERSTMARCRLRRNGATHAYHQPLSLSPTETPQQCV